MQAPINPFRLQRMGKTLKDDQPQASATSASYATTVRAARGQSGQERAKVLASIAQDVSIRAARIQFLKTMGHKIYEKLEDGQEIGMSRLAWLQKQLNQEDQ